MPTIVPAILEQTREGLEDKLFQITRIAGVERIQIDFADGEFVPNKTLPATEFDPLNPAFHWEAHLMTKPPHNFLDYQIAGFKTVILHYEAFGKEEHLDDTLSEIKKCGLQPGLAISPETPVSVLRYFGDTIDHFVVMSVHPGLQGQPFLEESFDRVAELSKLLPHAMIEVDGGVNKDNIAALVNAGADLLAVGSALFESDDLNKNYLELASVVTQKNENQTDYGSSDS